MSKSEKSLLILDDVWSPEVAKAFSACCNVIVTSRNAAIASEVETRQVFNVSVSEGEGCPWYRLYLCLQFQIRYNNNYCQ